MAALFRRHDAMGNVLRKIARSPFVAGMARGLDLMGTRREPMPYSRDENPWDADRWAMWSDWYTVGCDIASATQEFEEREHAKH
jgi:hypothetical protein